MIVRIVVGLCLILVIGGCDTGRLSQTTVAPSAQPSLISTPPQSQAEPSVTPAKNLKSTSVPHEPVTPTPAPLGSPENPIVVAVYPGLESEPELLRRSRESAERLAQITELAITILAPSSFQGTLEGIESGGVHITSLPPLTYLVAHERGHVDVAMLSASLGQVALGAIEFVANPDRGFTPEDTIDALQQFANKRPCWIEDRADIGYILPVGILARKGIPTQPAMFVESEPAMFRAIYEGRCEFGGTAARDLRPSDYQVLQDLPDIDEKVIAIYTSEQFLPGLNVSYSTRLPSSLRNSITAAFTQLASTQSGLETIFNLLGGGGGFALVPVDDSSYSDLRAYVNASGIDIEPFVVGAGIAWIAPPGGTIIIDVQLPVGGAPFLPGLSNAPLTGLAMPPIYGELARMDAYGQYAPYLASHLPALGNGQVRFVGSGEDEQLEVEFQLRPGLKWQDGQALTADDLVFSWNLVMNPAWSGYHYGTISYAPEIYVDAVEAPAPDRVVYRFMSQRQAREAASTGGRLGDPALYANLAEQVGPVVPLDYLDVGRNVLPKHLLEGIPVAEIAESEFARRPVYAGPYRLVEGGGDGEPVVLEAFEDFFLGKPTIERIVFGPAYYSQAAEPYWQAPEALAEALPVGAVQAQLSFPAVRSREGADPLAYDALAQQGLATVEWAPRDGWEVLDFNLDNPHLADLRVRQAIAHAINRQAIIGEALAGHGDLMRSYLPAWHPLYAGDDDLPEYAYDPDVARALLEEAGYDLSQFPAAHAIRGPLTLRLVSMDVAPYPRQGTAALIKEELAEIGIDLEVQFYEWPEFEGEDCSAIRNGRQFDLGMAGWLGGGLYPLWYIEHVTASWSIPTPENGCPFDKANWSGWRKARVDEIIPLLKDGRLALEQPEVYRQLWAEHQVLWATELPSLPLFNVQRPVVIAPGLEGVQPSPFAFGGGVEDTWNVFEWRLETP